MSTEKDLIVALQKQHELSRIVIAEALQYIEDLQDRLQQICDEIDIVLKEKNK